MSFGLPAEHILFFLNRTDGVFALNCGTRSFFCKQLFISNTSPGFEIGPGFGKKTKLICRKLSSELEFHIKPGKFEQKITITKNLA